VPDIVDPTSDVASRLGAVEARIRRAERDFDRTSGAVSLVAVSKTFPADAITPALAAGHRMFGENRVQESKAKWPGLRAAYPDVELHLIGPLQSNKAREAIELFDVIETVDRPRIAEALAAAIARAGKAVKLFIEVNTGAEPQKAGVLPDEADAFVRRCREDLGLAIAGLMCIPPADRQASPHFALLASIAARNGVAGLSMGMSADFELGIQLGATHVRVGSAIFGTRPSPR
jgi:pyridoxal phosphate enzyme (YggS family)